MDLLVAAFVPLFFMFCVFWLLAHLVVLRAPKNCRQSADDDECWTSLRNGFFVPVDDIRDLLPPVAERPRNSSAAPDDRAGDGFDPVARESGVVESGLRNSALMSSRTVLATQSAS
ncbi:MAG: hypothetical protein O3A00_16765 [Planctomycetota bacterium]|nr:hypothetical protein [Planctomycetota bacterium]